MNNLLLTTKLSIPAPRVGLISRPRLTERLEQATRLALVTAPAGWGKSSVVSEWCAQKANGSPAVAWVSLDASDNDPVHFLLYLSAAFDRAHPGLGEATRSLLQLPQPIPPETALTVLLNEINALDLPLALILDDYHLIESPPVHNAMTFLLDHQPPNLRLVIATRTDPPLPLSRMRVRGQLTELRANDLRFTHAEAGLFLNQIMGLKLDAEAVSRLESRTEGWIAGLQLAAISLQGRTNPAEFLDSFTGSNRYIVDYLFDEVLARQTGQMQTFLQETSILNRLCGPLCEAVVGQPGGQAMLEQLEASNLFLIPLDEERRWYRYHHLFADVLQGRLAQQGAERAAELHKRAARWFEEQGIGEAAIHHALAGNNVAQAAQLLEQYVGAVWSRGEQHTLEQWLRALPAEIVRSRPMLCAEQARIYLHSMEIDALAGLLNECRPDVLSENAWERDIQGRLLAVEGFLARIRGDYQHALEVSQKAYACFTKDNIQWRGGTLLNLGSLYFENGDLQAATEALQESVACARTGEDIITVLLSTSVLGELRKEQGALREAGRLFQTALDYAMERKVPQYSHLGFAFAGLGRLHTQWNDLLAAQACLEEGLKCKIQGFFHPCHLEMLNLKRTQGDEKGFLLLFEQIEAMPAPPGNFDFPSLLAALRTRLQPERKENQADWLERYEREREGKPLFTFPYLAYRHTEMLAWAWACLTQGRSDAVKAPLESLLETFIQQRSEGAAVEVRTLLARLYCQEGRMDRAVSVLEPALVLAAQEGYVRVFLDAGKSLVSVLRQAAAQGIESEYVAQLLTAFREAGLLQEKQKAEQDSFLRDPLSERELEVLRLVTAGMSNPEIAEHLFLSVGTVKRHVYNIYIKMEVTGRVEAVTRARELKLL